MEAKDEMGWTPLYMAAERGDAEAVDLLLGLGAGADVEVHDPLCPTPLHAAARSGAHRVMEVLLAGGAEVNVRNLYGETPLHLVENCRGAKEAVQLLLEHGAEVDARNEYDETPLHFASRWGSEAAMQLLLEHGAEVDARDKAGYTPLCEAAGQGHHKAVQLLLHNGADANAKDQYGYVPLHIAAGAYWQLDEMEGYDSVRMVATVELLISKGGADVNARDSLDGWTPLHCASAEGWVEVAQLLLDNGAQVGAKNTACRTPPHNAANGFNGGSAEVVRLLVAAGANINAVDNDGDTPVALAALEGNAEPVQALISLGADTADPKLHSVPLVDRVEALLRECEAGDDQAWEREVVANQKQVLRYLRQQRAS